MRERCAVTRFGLTTTVLVCLGALAAVSAVESDLAYRASVKKWRADREARLKADGGWLTVAGLFWLHEGDNRFGTDPHNEIVLPAGSSAAQAGVFQFHDGKASVHPAANVALMIDGKRVDSAVLHADSDPAFNEKTDQVTLGSLTFYIHSSGQRRAVRLLDTNSPIRKKFVGLRWFPVDPAYRIVADYVPYKTPKAVQIQNMMGDFTPDTIAGYAAFKLQGKDLRLDMDVDSEGYSITFNDLTSGKETYGAARFLVGDPPKDGKVVLDFNEAYNPPCAFNPYTTCPLPTPENRLKVRVAAGEMTYLGPH